MPPKKPAKKTSSSRSSGSRLPRLSTDSSGCFIVPHLDALRQSDDSYLHTVEHNGESIQYGFGATGELYDPMDDLCALASRSGNEEDDTDDDNDDDLEDDEEKEIKILSLINSGNYSDFLAELDNIYDIMPPVLWMMWSTFFITNVRNSGEVVTPMNIRDRDWLPRFNIAHYQYQVANKILGITHPNLMAAAVGFGTNLGLQNHMYKTVKIDRFH